MVLNALRIGSGFLVTGAALFAGAVHEGVAVLEAPDASLSIVLEDRAHTGAKALYRAENLASGILSHAGVVSHWTTYLHSDSDTLLNNFRRETGTACGQPLDTAEIRVVILPRAPSGFFPGALGFASPCAREGMQATIYADRVESVSHASPASLPRVLAYALIHEIGHVLLRSGVHDSSGLMKGIWGKRDWQRAAVELIPFSKEEEDWIRQEIQQLAAPPMPVSARGSSFSRFHMVEAE